MSASAFAIVAAVAARHALSEPCGLRLSLRYDGIGVDPYARVQFAGDDRYYEFDLSAGERDEEAFRGLVELEIFKFRTKDRLE